MEVAHEKLLKKFETFEADLEVDEILKKVKEELAVWTQEDHGSLGKAVEREQLKGAARSRQTRGSTSTRTCNTSCATLNSPVSGSSEGLDFCCDYWRYEFKRPATPPPAPPPSPEVSRKRGPPPQQPTTTHDVPTKQRRR